MIYLGRNPAKEGNRKKIPYEEIATDAEITGFATVFNNAAVFNRVALRCRGR